MIRGGKWLAEERGAFDPKPEPEPPEPEPVTPAATAPLIEVAAEHMVAGRFISFWRWYGDLN